MGWSSEVHARRTLEYRDHVRKEKEAGIYSVPKIKGNAALLPFAVATGVSHHTDPCSAQIASKALLNIHSLINLGT